MPKSSSKMLFKLNFFHDALYGCGKYSNLKCQDEILEFNKDLRAS